MIQRYENLEAVSEAAAELFAARAKAAARDRGRFSVALAGGNTPRRAYELLAQPPLCDSVPWYDVHVFWGDERRVPPDDPRSNYRMAREAFLDRLPLLDSQIHPMCGVGDPDEAALEYERQLKQFFADGQPRFDLVLLGMGDNAHTASLFPGLPVLEESARWVSAVYIAELQMHRLTLTAPAINQAATIAFLVAGADKAQPLKEVLQGPPDPQRLPAQLVQPVDGELLWLVDKTAAAQL